MSGTFSGCTSLKTYVGSADPDGDFSDYVIPESVTNMSSAFKNCTLLTTAPVIPNGVTNMENTFNGCASLTTAPVIPNSVTNISYTFASCTSLKTYVGGAGSNGDFSGYIIPSGVTNMRNTFYGCKSLTGNIEINANPTSYANCFILTEQAITITGSCSDATKAALAGTANKGNVSY